MYVLGHVGAAMLAYAPAAALLTWLGHPELAALGTVTAVGLSTLPDIDHNLPMEHRAGTHTVFFAGAVGSLAAVAGALVAAAGLLPFEPGGTSQTGLTGLVATVPATAGIAAVLSICSHILADCVTPMGVCPFAPLSRWQYSADIVPSKHQRANVILLLAGVAVASGSQALVVLLSGS